MYLIKLSILSILLVLSFTMSGCQGNNSDAPVSSSPDINSTVPDINITVPDINTTVPDVPDTNLTTNVEELDVTFSSGQTTVINIATNSVNLVIAEDNAPAVAVNVIARNTDTSDPAEGTVKPAYPIVLGKTVSYLGTVTPTDGIDISNGMASFIYTPPSNIEYLRSLGFNGATFLFYASNDVNTTFNILFSNPLYANYNLNVYPENNLTITPNEESQVLELYLEDNRTNLPIANESIIVESFDSVNKGTLNSFSGTTNESGRVIFNYIPPEDISTLNGQSLTLTFKLASDTTKRISKTINFDTTVVTDPKYVTYKPLEAYPDPKVTITAAGQTAVLEAYLENNSDLPVSGEDIVVEFFDVSKGTLNSFSATTDANGHVAFNYTAPADISIADINVTMKLRGDTTNSDYVAFDFDTTSPVKDYSNYKISLVNETRTITQRFQVETFNVYLEDNSTGVVKAAVGDIVVVDFFDGNSGTLNSFSALTDANGRAQFTYTAPENLTDLNGTKITFRVQNTTATNNFVESTLTVSADSSSLARLQMSKSTLDIVRDAQVESIIVLAFNAQGEAYSGGSVSLRYPDEITNNGVSGGIFAQSSVEIVNGQAIFDFVGPNTLESLSSLNFEFIYSEDSNISTTLTINYQPETPTIVVDDGNITITQNGEIRTINLSVFSEDKSLYPDGNIGIKYPPEALEGKNVGKFNTLSSPVVNGKASFVYTAPNPLDGNDTIGFTFYHDEKPTLSEKDFNITITPDVGQIVLTNYILDATYETSMSLDTTKGMKFYIEDEEGNLINDSNITSMRVSILNAALGSLEDTNNNKGTTLTIGGENSVQINIRSNTISGIIPIEVYSEFKDANSEDKNLTKVFNIVVLSGPPTAMSLSYASTEQNAETAKFVENWVLTITDEYNNLVNSKPSISMGALIGYAQSSAATSNAANYLYYNPSSGSGTLNDANPDTFTAGANAFDNVDLVNDKLVLFGGTGYRFDAFGKWDINNINASDELELVDDYNGTGVSDLGYAVGNNFRNEVCSGNSVVANVYAKDGNNVLGTTGSMIIQVEYDYYLVGKDIVLWTNLVGSSNNSDVKIGLGRKVTLRGQGLESPTFDVSSGYNGVITLPVKISGTVEEYKNGNFSYAIETTTGVTVNNIVGSSMDSIYSCGLNTTDALGKTTFHNGQAYVDLNITENLGSNGEIHLVNIILNNEF